MHFESLTAGKVIPQSKTQILGNGPKWGYDKRNQRSEDDPRKQKNEKLMSDDRVQQEKSDLNSRKPKAKSKPNQPTLHNHDNQEKLKPM